MSTARYLAPYILITAFGYVFAKSGMTFASPMVYGALISLITTLGLLAVSRGRIILNRDTALFGVFYWLSSTTWLVGLNLISPSQSAILSFTMPLFAIPLSIYVLSERASRVEAYGAIIGFSGIVLFNLPLLGGAGTFIGGGLSVADAFFWALFSVYMRKLRVQDTAQTVLAVSFVSFLLYSAFSAFDFSFRPSLNLLIDLGYNGALGGALDTFFWMVMLKTEKLARLTTLLFIAPVVTLGYDVATTGVIPNYLTLGGVVLIFVGIYTSNILGGSGGGSVPPPVAAAPILEYGS